MQINRQYAEAAWKQNIIINTTNWLQQQQQQQQPQQQLQQQQQRIGNSDFRDTCQSLFKAISV